MFCFFGLLLSVVFCGQFMLLVFKSTRYLLELLYP